MNVKSAILRVRDRIHDREARAFDDEELLRSFDDAVSDVFTAIRTHGDSHGLDYDDVLVSSLTPIETDVRQYTPPIYVSDPQLLELVTGGTNGIAYPLVKAPLEHKDQARGVFPGARAVWHWGPKGTIHIRGHVGGFTTLRVWYIRQLAPLFYCVASGASTENLIVPVQEDGTFQPGDGVYVGMEFECTKGPSLGFVSRCTSHVEQNLGFTKPFPYPTANDEFACVLPVPPEYRNYLVSLVTAEMFTRQGDAKERAAAERKLLLMRQDFEAGIAVRSSGEPTRFYSSRSIR